MNITITNRIKNELSVNYVKGLDIEGNIISVFFFNETDSISNFNRIRQFGLNCRHAGKNSPQGPMVTMTRANSYDFNIKIQ